MLLLMFFVLFFHPDRSLMSARKFPDLVSARKYLEVFDQMGSVNYVVTSYDLQTVFLKSYSYDS